MAGLVRLVSESFGATLGSALIYTVGGMLLLIVRRPKPISQAPRKYLVAGGLMFIAYETSISLSIGLATTNAQSVEVSLVNYLWPTLLVLMTAAVFAQTRLGLRSAAGCNRSHRRRGNGGRR